MRGIDRIWSRHVAPGVEVNKQYRDKAGAHADRIDRYFAAKLRLHAERDQVLTTPDAFLWLSIALTKK